MQKSQSNLTIMRSFRCSPTLAQIIREAANRLQVNESVLFRIAVTTGVHQIVKKHLQKEDN
jgi:hypothetical protein